MPNKRVVQPTISGDLSGYALAHCRDAPVIIILDRPFGLRPGYTRPSCRRTSRFERDFKRKESHYIVQYLFELWSGGE